MVLDTCTDTGVVLEVVVGCCYNCHEETHTHTRTSFVGAAIVSLINGLSLDLSIKAGLRAAYKSLQSHHAVCTELNSDWLNEQLIQNWAPWEPTVVQV